MRESRLLGKNLPDWLYISGTSQPKASSTSGRFNASAALARQGDWEDLYPQQQRRQPKTILITDCTLSFSFGKRLKRDVFQKLLQEGFSIYVLVKTDAGPTVRKINSLKDFTPALLNKIKPISTAEARRLMAEPKTGKTRLPVAANNLAILNPKCVSQLYNDLRANSFKARSFKVSNVKYLALRLDTISAAGDKVGLSCSSYNDFTELMAHLKENPQWFNAIDSIYLDFALREENIPQLNLFCLQAKNLKRIMIAPTPLLLKLEFPLDVELLFLKRRYSDFFNLIRAINPINPNHIKLLKKISSNDYDQEAWLTPLQINFFFTEC